MKKVYTVQCVMSIFIILFAGWHGNIARAQQVGEKMTGMEPLPVSLDNLYPPRSEQPVFLFSKLELGTQLSGIMVNLMENDFPNARVSYDRFRMRYLEISQMVPEWKGQFPLDPVTGLGEALKSGDQPRIMAAFEGVGRVCSDCHVDNMARVQQKYHWKNFGEVSLSDPLSKEEVDFARYMMHLETNFSGIGVNLSENQADKARQQFEMFSIRFEELGRTCATCHDSERKYFVDEEIQKMVAQLGQSLKDPAAEGEKIKDLSQAIGMESCFKCHLVHIPAAMAQKRLRGAE